MSTYDPASSLFLRRFAIPSPDLDLKTQDSVERGASAMLQDGHDHQTSRDTVAALSTSTIFTASQSSARLDTFRERPKAVVTPQYDRRSLQRASPASNYVPTSFTPLTHHANYDNCALRQFRCVERCDEMKVLIKPIERVRGICPICSDSGSADIFEPVLAAGPF